MQETYDGYHRRTQEVLKAENTIDPRTIRLAMQAAVSADKLMGDQNWDPYLQSIQYAVECVDKDIENCKEQLYNPRIVDQSIMMQLKITLAGLEGQKLALDWAISLPSDICKNGEAAKKLHDFTKVKNTA